MRIARSTLRRRELLRRWRRTKTVLAGRGRARACTPHAAPLGSHVLRPPCRAPQPGAQGLCCSQRGVCTNVGEACWGTCQCRFSGKGSKCAGKYPLPIPDPKTLPTAPSGGVCGPHVAHCPTGEQ